jgi:radical SAM superfamily enzyme YgiQ (UPF0313 family)
LISSIEKGADTSSILGIVYKKDGDAVATPPRPVLRDLDELPLPAWDLVDIDSYRKIWEKHHGYFSLNLATTRGCPFQMQLVRKANLREPLHFAFAGTCRQ